MNDYLTLLLSCSWMAMMHLQKSENNIYLYMLFYFTNYSRYSQVHSAVRRTIRRRFNISEAVTEEHDMKSISNRSHDHRTSNLQVLWENLFSDQQLISCSMRALPGPLGRSSLITISWKSFWTLNQHLQLSDSYHKRLKRKYARKPTSIPSF